MSQRALPSFEDLYRQIAALPPGVTGEILEPGLVRTMSRPGRRHRRTAKRISVALRDEDRDQGGKGWWIEIEAEIRLLGTRLTVPDLAAWRVARVPALPDENPLTILPDWVCEVYSPTTRKSDPHEKLPLYVASGIPWIWMVDPEAQLVEVYVPDGGFAKLVASVAGDEIARLAPFEIAMPLSLWWRDPRPEESTG